MNDIVPRTTITDMSAKRDAALGLFSKAHMALQSAAEALDAAKIAANEASSGINRYTFHNDDAKRAFLSGLQVPTRDDFMAVAQRHVDIDVWAKVIELSDLEKLMDKQSKDELQQSLLQNPPEATADNIIATLQEKALEADMMWKRGIANCFSKLDRRFKSHNSWKIGSRVILTRVFSDWGMWNYHANHQDTLTDIERVFFILDGLDVPETYYGIVAVVEKERGHRNQQAVVETEFFKVCCYKNGNMHVWFQRKDLLEKVNKLLGEYYDTPIPEEREAEDDGGLFTPKTSLAKNLGWFPTPEPVAERVIDAARIFRPDDAPKLRVLEPSAGLGNLAKLAVGEHAIVDCVEIDPGRSLSLRRAGLYNQVLDVNFLALEPAAFYDRVIMNPPFDRERDIDHVVHAMKFLKPDGLLIAVMSAGTEFRQTKKSEAFRKLIDSKNGKWQDLPAGSFASTGTYVNTMLLKVYNDGHPGYF